MIMWFICSAVSLLLLCSVTAQIEKLSCGYLTLTREVDGPAESENYWNGTVMLPNWLAIPCIVEERLTFLTVDNPAKIEIVSSCPIRTFARAFGTDVVKYLDWIGRESL